MPIEHIRDPGDPRVAPYRGASDAALLTAHGQFMAEGRLIVQRLIEGRRHAVRSVLVNEAAYRALEATLATLGADVPIYRCRAEDFPSITGYDFHRGCLALVARPPARSVDELSGNAAGACSAAGPATLVILEGVTNADNVGGVFRNVAAFGADGVVLSPGCCDPLYRKAIRTSMAATLRVPFARADDWPAGIAILRDRGFTLVALTPRATVTLETFAASRPARVALLVGTEGEGLTTEVEALADVRVRIPIAPAIDSLNLAVAVGIALNRLGPVRE